MIVSVARPSGVQLKKEVLLLTVIVLKLSIQTVTSHLFYILNRFETTYGDFPKLNRKKSFFPISFLHILWHKATIRNRRNHRKKFTLRGWKKLN